MRIYDKSVRFVRLNQYLEPNWQLFEEVSNFSEDFGFLMPSLFLTLNVEPVNGYAMA
jgi:hypothetical protein